jgi:membrane protease YdiL (CAAX protease family)
MEWFAASLESIRATATRHGIDPSLFVLLYLGSIPPYLLSIAWLLRRLRRRQPAALALLSTAFFFILPAAYIGLAGDDLPPSVYAVLALFVGFGAWSAVRKLRRSLEQAPGAGNG